MVQQFERQLRTHLHKCLKESVCLCSIVVTTASTISGNFLQNDHHGRGRDQYSLHKLDECIIRHIVTVAL